jgi:hypothetical protein
MTTQLNLKYAITFNASTKVIDNAGEFSSEDSVQQQLQFNSNSLLQSAASRIEVQLLPTPYLTPSNGRVYDIDLDALNIGYLRTLYIKSDNQFLFSMANTLSNLNTQLRTLGQAFVLDRGVMPPLNIFVPDEAYPRYIRLMNPLEINGGGTGNNDADIPITVSIFIINTPITPNI